MNYGKPNIKVSEILNELFILLLIINLFLKIIIKDWVL